MLGAGAQACHQPGAVVRRACHRAQRVRALREAGRTTGQPRSDDRALPRPTSSWWQTSNDSSGRSGTRASRSTSRSSSATSRAAIVDTAGGLASDMIVIGTHGRGGFDHLMLGSVAEKVLRKAPCPVFIVPSTLGAPRPTGRLRHILCPVDFGPTSMRAVEHALSLAQEANAALTVLHVIEAVPDEAMTHGVCRCARIPATPGGRRARAAPCCNSRRGARVVSCQRDCRGGKALPRDPPREPRAGCGPHRDGSRRSKPSRLDDVRFDDESRGSSGGVSGPHPEDPIRPEIHGEGRRRRSS